MQYNGKDDAASSLILPPPPFRPPHPLWLLRSCCSLSFGHCPHGLPRQCCSRRYYPPPNCPTLRHDWSRPREIATKPRWQQRSRPKKRRSFRSVLLCSKRPFVLRNTSRERGTRVSRSDGLLGPSLCSISEREERSKRSSYSLLLQSLLQS